MKKAATSIINNTLQRSIKGKAYLLDSANLENSIMSLYKDLKYNIRPDCQPVYYQRKQELPKPGEQRRRLAKIRVRQRLRTKVIADVNDILFQNEKENPGPIDS